MTALGRARISRWVQKGRPIKDPDVRESFQAIRAAMGLRGGVSLVESAHVRGPLTIGVFRPTVVLPNGLPRQLADSELRDVAVHELAHVKRWDTLLLALLSFMRAFLYFNPLVWLACRQVSALAENACDDAVLELGGQPLPYAKMLTRLAEELPRQSLATELAVGVVLSRNAFLRRIEAILSDRRYQFRRLSRAALAAIVLAAALSVGLALTVPLGERATSSDTAGEAAGGQDREAGVTAEPLPSPAPEGRNATAADPPSPLDVEIPGVSPAFNQFLARIEVEEIRCGGKTRKVRKKRHSLSPEGKLVGLQLKECGIEKTDFPLIGQLRDLETLDLYGVEMDAEDMRHLGGLTNLRVLVLSRTRTSGSCLVHLGGMQKLESLAVRLNSVGDDDLRHLRGLTALRHLDLSCTRIGDAGLKHIAAMRQIETLRLGDTDITDKGLRQLENLKNLRGLTLNETGVSKAGLEYLAGFPAFRWVASPDDTAREFVGRAERGDHRALDEMSTPSVYLPKRGNYRLVTLAPLQKTEKDRARDRQSYALEMHWTDKADDLDETIYATFAVDRGAVFMHEVGILSASWGKAVDGVQVRLRTRRALWKASEDPGFAVDIRNRGKRELTTSLLASLVLELDGQAFAPRTWSRTGLIPIEPFGPGSEYTVDIVLSHFRPPKHDGEFPAPGKHTVKAVLLDNHVGKDGIDTTLGRYKQMTLATSGPLRIRTMARRK